MNAEAAGRLLIRELTTKDLDEVATVHANAFPDSALTKLGTAVIRRYYEWQLDGPHDCYAIGAFNGERLYGFCFGGVFRGSLSGFLNENRLFLMTRILKRPHLLAMPLVRDRIRQAIESLRSRRGRSSEQQEGTRPKTRSFGILAVAVDPTRHGRGIGQLLMEASETEARRRGFESMHLTVRPDNEQAVRFYDRQNWRRVSSTDMWTGLMRKAL